LKTVLSPQQRFRSLPIAGLVVLLALAAASASVSAQQSDAPDPNQVKIRFGPLWMNPTIALTNIGVDQNVFNDPVDPKQDFTFTVTPNSELWLHAGRTWVVGSMKEDIIWYQTYNTERAANNTYTVGWKVPLNRLNVSIGAKRASLRDRPGFEIDARAQRNETTYDAKVEVKGLSKTFIGVTATLAKEDFDEAVTFKDVNLSEQLNHTTTTVGVTLREQITTLTSISAAALRSEDRFDGTSLRDSKSMSATATLAFDPAALIKGSATVGYRDFRPDSPDLPRFSGITSSVNLTYVLLGATRLAATYSRDLSYSYDINQPYYLQNAVNGSIAQQLFGPFDIVARGGLASMAYENRAGAIVLIPDRTDTMQTYGGGIGFHMSKDLRLGVNIDKERRQSEVATRKYDNLKIGSSVTYGF
jgi:hypothetical protein